VPLSAHNGADLAGTGAERTDSAPLASGFPGTLLGGTNTLLVDTSRLLAAASRLRALLIPRAPDAPDPAATGDGFVGAALSEIWDRYSRSLDLLVADHLAAVDHITATADAYTAVDAAIMHALSACSPPPPGTSSDHPAAERGSRWK
jgi:hypothetical protein